MNTGDTAPAEFKGWATVEIMGHQQVSGFVETRAFGACVMFEVSVPALEPVEQITEKDLSLNYQRIPAGSKIRISRDATQTLVGAASVYRMTRCTEEQALARSGQKVEILELADVKQLPKPTSEDEDEFDPNDCDEECDEDPI